MVALLSRVVTQRIGPYREVHKKMVVGTLDQGYPLLQHEDTVPTQLSLVTW
jgi:hypothetical protein